MVDAALENADKRNNEAMMQMTAANTNLEMMKWQLEETERTL